MLAAVTRSPGVLVLGEVAEPGPPGRQDVILRPEAVGLCDTDLSLFTGSVAAGQAGPLLPRIQGHELCAVIEETGRDCARGLRPGERVAVWPLHGCGRCYPCRVGRGNACAARELVGVHIDGGLQQLLRLPDAQVYPVGDLDPAAAAFVQPMSLAVRGLQRAEIRPGQQVVVLGAGPLGLAMVIAATAAGARVLAADPAARRRELAAAAGAEAAAGTGPGELASAAAAWARRGGPPRVIDTTGQPGALAQAMELVCAAGRVVVLGMTAGTAPLRPGILAEKEIDVAGSRGATAADFRAAIRLIRAHRDAVAALISHRFPLARARDAFECLRNPAAGAVKVLIDVGGRPA